MRIYIPYTVNLLRDAVHLNAAVTAVAGRAFAVTDELRTQAPFGDQEEWEYLVMGDAARASLRLLAAGSGPFLRVVVVAETDLAVPDGQADRAAVRLRGSVPWSQVVAVHMDGGEIADIVQRAAASVHAADLGDMEAEYLVGDAEDHQLAWYAPDEASFLLEDFDLS